MTVTATSNSITDRSPHKVLVKIVVPDRPPYRGAQIDLSCGHSYHLASFGPLPQVGDTKDCSRCESDAWHAANPPLPEEQIEAIKATFPKCPECGGDIEKIPFVKRTVHKFYVEVNEQDGSVALGAEHEDTLEETPDWITHTENGNSVRELKVECANGHSWLERRLAYKYDYRLDEHFWTFLPTEAQP